DGYRPGRRRRASLRSVDRPISCRRACGAFRKLTTCGRQGASIAPATESFRLVLGGHLLGAFGVVLTLEDTRGFSTPAAQIIKLGAADLAAADHFDGVDHRRIERKYPLDAFPVGDLCHPGVLVEPGAAPAAAP